jgi:hypothetical protein
MCLVSVFQPGSTFKQFKREPLDPRARSVFVNTRAADGAVTARVLSNPAERAKVIESLPAAGKAELDRPVPARAGTEPGSASARVLLG